MQVSEYRLANQELVRLALSDLDSFVGSLNLNGDPTAVKAALLEFFPELVSVYGSTAAVLGADFYDMLRSVPPSSASFRAASAQPVAKAQADGAVGYAVAALFQSEPDTSAVRGRLAGASQRLVWSPFRETVFNAAANDPVRTGVARVPAGSTTCRWCTMLASRGAVYRSKSSAGDERRFHDHCDCMTVVARSADDYPDGYDVEQYRALYRAGEGVAPAA